MKQWLRFVARSAVTTFFGLLLAGLCILLVKPFQALPIWAVLTIIFVGLSLLVGTGAYLIDKDNRS